MFRTYRNPYSLRRKKSRGRLWVILLWVVLGIVGIELATRLVVWLAGERSTLLNYQGKPPELFAYTLQALNPEAEPIPGAKRGELHVQPDWLQGYRLMESQSTEFWTINEQGFRTANDIPLAKPDGEIRIFLLGSSSMFGQGLAADTETIAAQLYQRLQQRLADQQEAPGNYRPDVLPVAAAPRQAAQALPTKLKTGQYRVINAAIPASTSGNQLAQLTLQILPYEPDVIVVMHGYDDLMLPSSEKVMSLNSATIALEQPWRHALRSFSSPIVRSVQQMFVVKALQYYWLKPEPSLLEQALPLATPQEDWSDYLPMTEEELAARLDRHRNHVKQMIQICAGARVPLIIALQPEITGLAAEQREVEEGAIAAELPNEYRTILPLAYQKLQETNEQLGSAFPNNVKILNFYDLFNNLSATAFADPVNLTPEGQKAIADQFYGAIETLPQLQAPAAAPPPPGSISNY
jgi:hypothetical protein